MSFSLFACVDSELASKDAEGGSMVVYLDAAVTPSQLSIDNYRIVSVSQDGDMLTVVVDYSGGCGDHLFLVWVDVESSDENDVNVYLIHDGQGDACEAQVRDTVSINTLEVFSGENQNAIEEIELINISNNQEISIEPVISSLSSTGCTVEVNLLNVECTTGIWGTLQMELLDTAEVFNNVLLQPVLSDINARPTEGKALVEIDVLFGYKYPKSDDSTIICDRVPVYNKVPVRVNCLTKL